MEKEEIDIYVGALVKQAALLRQRIDKAKRGEKHYLLGYMHGLNEAVALLQQRLQSKGTA